MPGVQTLGKLALSVVISYLVTAVSLVVMALILYKFSLGTNGVELGISVIYLLSSAMGGFWIGKRIENRRFLWGMLAGCLYVLVLFVISLLLRGNVNGIAEQGISTLLVCLCGGTLGGMLS